MAKKTRKLTIQELASATGQKDGTVRQHIARKRIKKGKDGFIDVEDDLNKAYINEVTGGRGLYTKVVKESASESPVTAKKEPSAEEVANSNFYTKLDKRKREADLELVEHNLELKKIELEKKAGNLLPIQIIENIVVINIQAIIKNFEIESENIASLMVDRFGGSRKDLAEINQMLREVIGKAVAKAKQDANKEIKTAVEAYQETRGVGEKR